MAEQKLNLGLVLEQDPINILLKTSKTSLWLSQNLALLLCSPKLCEESALKAAASSPTDSQALLQFAFLILLKLFFSWWSLVFTYPPVSAEFHSLTTLNILSIIITIIVIISIIIHPSILPCFPKQCTLVFLSLIPSQFSWLAIFK